MLSSSALSVGSVSFYISLRIFMYTSPSHSLEVLVTSAVAIRRIDGRDTANVLGCTEPENFGIVSNKCRTFIVIRSSIWVT